MSLILSVFAPTLLLSLAEGILLPTLPLYAKSFGVSNTLISVAVAAAGLGTLMGDVPAGALLERYGRKPVMVVGTVALAVATLLLGSLQFFWALLALRFLVGIGTAMWNVSRIAYVTEAVPLRDRGRALSTFGGVTRIGAFLGPTAGGLIATWYGLAAPFYAAALAAAGAALISMLFIRETHAGQSAVRQVRWKMVGQVAKRQWRDLAAAGSAQVYAQMIRNGRQLIVPLYAYEVLGLNAGEVGTILSLASAIDMSLFIPAGVLMDKFGRKFAAVPSFLVLALGMGLLPFTSGYVSLLAVTAAMGAGNGIGAGTMMTLGSDLAPRQGMGEFLGVWRLIGDAGQSAGPLAVGALADTVGLSVAAFSLSGVGVLAAATLVFLVQETLHHRPVHAPVRIDP